MPLQSHNLSRARPTDERGHLVMSRKGNASTAEGELYSTSVARVTRGGIIAFGIFVAGAALTYCSQLLIARIVGPDTFGIYTYVFAWMVVLAFFSTLGFDVALLRFVPAYRAGRAWALAK